MRVVINKQYGGFSLSREALVRARELGADWVVLKGERYHDGSGPASWDTASPQPERDDPILLQVVEELGSDADGRHASLSIVEIPDDVKWHIKEYDGMEWIAEDHRTWS